MADDWSRIECEAIMEDYFDMLFKELSGTIYNKSEHRHALQAKLDSRSDGSIEYKHQNITAILIKAGHTYIKGYKPAWNYQRLLEDVVLDRIAQRSKDIRNAEDSFLARDVPSPAVIDWKTLFVEPPERTTEPHQINEPRMFKPGFTDYAEREARNRKLGK